MCTPNKQFTSFFDEMQEKFIWEIKSFVPLGYPDAKLIIKLTPRRIHHICPNCNCGCAYIHEHDTTRTIHGGTMLGVPIIYELDDSIRYKCGRCKATFFEKYDCIPEMHSITTETENYILWQLGTVPMSRIAQETGLSEQTIANRAIAFGKSEEETMLKGHYKYLSMDEVFIGRDHDNKPVIFWVLNDISVPWKANNIMLYTDRRKESVITRLMQLKHRDEVTAVSIDMWKQYKEAVELAIPNAAVVVDRFHVTQLAEKHMNNVRKNANCSKEDKADMKKDAALFLKSFCKLSIEELERLDNYLKKDPQLEKMYYILQDLLEFYNTRGFDEALELLCKWESSVIKSGVNEAVLLYNTIYEWIPYIMNYFIYRISNGKTEGKNNLIRQIDRMGFHYGLDCMRGCLYAHDRKQEYDKWKRHQKKCEKAQEEAESQRIILMCSQSIVESVSAA